MPTLDDVASNPRCLAGLSKSTILALLMRNAVAQSALTAAALAAEDMRDCSAVNAQDDDVVLLTIDEAAAIARDNHRSFLRRTRGKSFRRGSGKKILFEETGLRRWLAIRRT